MKDLSIVILNYKTSGLVKQSLRNLAQAHLSMSYEVIVIDNASGDDCIKSVEREFSDIVTIQNDVNVGFGAGNNRAIRDAKGEYILILNPDVAVTQEAINELFDYIKMRDNVSLVAPRLLNPDGSIQYSCLEFPEFLTPLYSRTFLRKIPRFRKKLERYRMMNDPHTVVKSVPWVLGACMMIRKSDFDALHGFDDRYFMYFEDIDLCRRIWSSGKRVIYNPKAEMVHYHQRLSADVGFIQSLSTSTLYYHLASWIKYMAKYVGKPLPKVFE